MSEPFLSGYARSLLRHLARRGPQTYDELFDHYVAGAHDWYPETLDGAITELRCAGIADRDGELIVGARR